MKLSNLNVTARLAGGFAVVILGALLLAATGWLGIHRQSQISAQVLDRDVSFARDIGTIRTQVLNLRRYEKDMLLNANDHRRVSEYKAKWDATHKKIEELVVRVRGTAVSDEERKRLEQFSAALAKYSSDAERIEAAVLAGQIKSAEQGNKKMEEFKQSIHDTEGMTQELYDGASKRIEGLTPIMAGIERDVTLVLGVAALVILVLAGLIAFFIARSITLPVGYAVRVAEALAQGDLSQTVEVRSNDELGRLMLALRGTVQQLGGIVGRIKETSDKVNAAAREIAQANLDLSTRTEEQASALEETSASMQQMSATVGQNAQNARTANDLAAQASGVASKGGEVVREAVGTMNGITESSKRIADIIGVIDGIAFQTNILALNAAVEAARAGDQGRGFAVVASEVRSLAQRSAGAAKEIKTLITDSVAKVDAGSRQVNEAGRTMDQVVSSVRKVNELIVEITKASEEQAQGIEQVTEAMTQLEQVTQQNAAMVEEASAAAGSLEEQSRSMSGAVGAFRLEGHAVAAPAPRTQRAAVAKPQAAPAAKRPAALPRRAEQHALAHGELGWQQF